MRVFLTGGTGMIGRRLVTRLLERGDSVTIVSRSADEIRRQPAFRNVRVVSGDPAHPGPWQDEIAEVDAVVNLAGQNLFAKRWTPAIRQEIRDSRVYSTDNLVTAIERARTRPVVFVQGSAIGYYGHTGDVELSETADSGVDFLAVTCRELEAAARPVASLGSRLVIVRTGVVLGNDQGALGAMVPVFRWGGGAPLGSGGHWLAPGRGQQWLSWIHLEDIVGLFLLAMDAPDAVGPINGTAPHSVRNLEFSRTLAKVLHRPCLPIGPPDFLLNLILGQVADAVTKGQRVVPNRALDLGYQFAFPELAEAMQDLLGRHRKVDRV